MTSKAQFIAKASAAGVLALAAAGLGAALLAQPAYAAEAIAITDVEGLKAMESNKTGSYYLAKDIDLSDEKDFELFKYSAFQGTLDGKGHAIKNFKRSETSKYKDASFALIDRANNATIKNLSLTGVKIAVDTPRGGQLRCIGEKCDGQVQVREHQDERHHQSHLEQHQS